MAYDERLANRIRERLADLDEVEEMKMMGGLVFMYKGKMCVGVIKDDMMCRIDPAKHDDAMDMHGCRTLDFVKRPMSGYVVIDETGMRSNKDFNYWIDLALEYNKTAKASKKRKK